MEHEGAIEVNGGQTINVSWTQYGFGSYPESSGKALKCIKQWGACVCVSLSLSRPLCVFRGHFLWLTFLGLLWVNTCGYFELTVTEERSLVSILLYICDLKHCLRWRCRLGFYKEPSGTHAHCSLRSYI